MLDDRKASILRAVVEEYIQTAQPVGSAHVSARPELAVSSATVRNEMGVLEREGYLAQPHTSAGRIPTDKGYRFFVDSMSPGALQPAQTAQVREFFARAHGEIEQMLNDTTRLLTNLTDYAAVVVGPAHHDVATVRSVQLVGLAARTALVVVVLSTGAVEKWPVEVPAQISDAQLGAVTAHLTAHLAGQAFGAEVALPATGDAVVDGLSGKVAAILTSASAGDGEQVFVGGASRMASAFDAVDTIRQVLGILEQQFVLVSLLQDVLDRGLSVAIGAEHGVQPLADCSVVVAHYTVEGEALGTVGVLGPTRMHYDQAMAAVAVVSKRLGQALTEG